MTGPTEPAPEHVASVIDRSATTAAFEHEIADALGQMPAGVAHPALVQAFQYSTHRSSGDGYFGPMMEFSDGEQIPPALSETSAATQRAWESVAALVTHPMALARLSDLLFEVRSGKVGEHGRTACRSYLELAETERAVEKERYALRALDLARRLADNGLAQRALAQMTAMVRAALAARHHGTSGRLLEALAGDRASVPELDGLLHLALESGPSAESSEHLLLLQRGRASHDQRPDLERRVTEVWINEARGEVGPVRAMHLQRAAASARKYGQRDLLDAVTVELQAVRIEDHDLERLGYASHLPPGAVDQLMAYYVDQPSTWPEAASLIATTGPPSGDVVRNRAAADESAHTSITANLPRMKLGGDGLPRWTAVTDEDMAESRLVDIETMEIRQHAPLMAEVLTRLRTKLGPLRAESFADVVGQSHLSTADLDAAGRALDHYGAGDWEAAVAIALPRVESLVRNLLRAAAHPIYRTQREKVPGQYPGLGALLGSAGQVGLDESWCRYLRTFLTSSVGFNYRNEVSHGFVTEFGKTEAAMVFLCILLLAAQTLSTPDVEPSNDGAGEPG